MRCWTMPGVTDPAAICRLLEADRRFALYALGDLLRRCTFHNALRSFNRQAAFVAFVHFLNQFS